MQLPSLYLTIIYLTKFCTQLQAMVEHGRVELLAHPLSQKYLEMKWNSYGKYFHLTHLLLYIIFLIFITFFSSNLMSGIQQIDLPKNTSEAIDEKIISVSFPKNRDPRPRLLLKSNWQFSAIFSSNSFCMYRVWQKSVPQFARAKKLAKNG